MTYMKKHPDMVHMPNGALRHPTRYMVKQLSGRTAGWFALFNTAEAARAEAFYMSDVHDICTAIYAPLHDGEQL